MAYAPNTIVFSGSYYLPEFNASTGAYQVDAYYNADALAIGDDRNDGNLSDGSDGDGAETAGEAIALEYVGNGYDYADMTYTGYMIGSGVVVADSEGHFLLLSNDEGLSGATGVAIATDLAYANEAEPVVSTSGGAWVPPPGVLLVGYAGADVLAGDAGDDTLSGEGGSDTLDGLAGNDVLNGGNGSDVLKGGDGDDMVNGGWGADVLCGGAGADLFVFKTDFNRDAADTITDFTSGVDKLQVSSRFVNLTSKGTIWAERLADGNVATEADDRFIFNSDTGALYYDADGVGTASAAVKVATLAGVTTLAASDIQIV